jgi:hypothetical protein
MSMRIWTFFVSKILLLLLYTPGALLGAYSKMTHIVRSRFIERLYRNYIDKKNLIEIYSEANN